MENICSANLEEETESGNPTPDNFDLFLPWACYQFQLNLELVIFHTLIKTEEPNRSIKSLNISKKTKIKKTEGSSESIKSESLNKQVFIHTENIVKLYTVYDLSGNLVQLKFDKNKNVSRLILKIIGLIVHFHKHLSSISINRGLNAECLLELSNLQSLANITDICLDNTCLGDGYEILLENKGNLKQLSISRCRLEDHAVEKIVSKIIHPLPASLTLSLLNLASNLITDNGAKYLALALRTNRTLVYINISDNSITDEGAGAILDVLGEFHIRNEELVESRVRNFQYIQEKKKLIGDLAKQLKSEDFEKRTAKKRTAKPVLNVGQAQKSKDEIDDSDAHWLEKAEFMAEKKLGEFREPFSSENVETKNGIQYCKGNNYLAYINLSYNNLTYLSLKKIVLVLKYQRIANRRPKGLVNISIEGNCIPCCCAELGEIDAILSTYLATASKRKSTVSNKSMLTNTASLKGKKI